MSYSIEEVLDATVRSMYDLYEWVVKDFQAGQTATPNKIERIIDEAGAGWDLGDDNEYTSDQDAYWCGYGVACAARRVGDYLEDDRCVDVALRRPIAAQCMGSTARLQQASWWDDVNAKPPTIWDASMIREGQRQVKRGHILIVGHDDPQWGDHIALARGGKEDGVYPTIEANARQVTLGDGTTGEGLGLRTRSPSELVSVIGLRLSHFRGLS